MLPTSLRSLSDLAGRDYPIESQPSHAATRYSTSAVCDRDDRGRLSGVSMRDIIVVWGKLSLGGEERGEDI